MEGVKINRVTGSIGNIPYTTELKAKSHVFIADEPFELGGQDKGPLAHDYLLGSLVACTCITMQMYARRKEWEAENIYIDARLERTTESGIQKTIAVLEIAIESQLSSDRIERLISIAHKCPVHKTLIPAMEIDIKLKNQ